MDLAVPAAPKHNEREHSPAPFTSCSVGFFLQIYPSNPPHATSAASPCRAVPQEQNSRPCYSATPLVPFQSSNSSPAYPRVGKVLKTFLGALAGKC